MGTGLLVQAVLSACGASQSTTDERVRRATSGTGDIVVGAPWPWRAQQGVRYGDGLQLALDEANAAGGIHGRKVRVERFDDNESVVEGLHVAQRLADDPDVVAVIGHLQSYVTIPASSIYELAGLVMLAPAATDPALTSHGYASLFRTTFTDITQGRALADYAARAGFRRVAICYIRNSYGRGIANAFEERATEHGVSIVARQSYEPNDELVARTLAPVLRSWLDREPDAIFVAGEVPSAPRVIAAARAQGIRVPVIGGDAMSSPELIRIGGASVEGTVVTSYFDPQDPRAEVQRFVSAFQHRYGVPPDAGAALGYDAMRLLSEGMRRARSVAPDDVARALHALHDWPGVTGTFTFDANGDLVNPAITTLVVRQGHFASMGRRAERTTPAPVATRGTLPMRASAR
jgi:branched-chain amino acid transport system substrate-binding protein